MRVDPQRVGNVAGEGMRVKVAQGLLVLAVILLFVAQFLPANPSPESFLGWGVLVGALEGLGTGFSIIFSSTGSTYVSYPGLGWQLVAQGIVFPLVYAAILAAPFLVGFLRRATPLRWLLAFLFAGLAGFVIVTFIRLGVGLDSFPPFVFAMLGFLGLTATALIVLPGHQKVVEVRPLPLADKPANERG